MGIQRIKLETRQRCELVEITSSIGAAVGRTGLRDGACVVFVPHTTAAICINENADPDVRSDVAQFLARLIPPETRFAHVEGNSDSHILAILTGPSVFVPVEEGRLHLGRWQGVYFAEFDGPRTREVWIQPLAAG